MNKMIVIVIISPDSYGTATIFTVIYDTEIEKLFVPILKQLSRITQFVFAAFFYVERL